MIETMLFSLEKYDFNLGPGPSVLKYGDMDLGYFGLTNYLDIGTSADLAFRSGLTEGSDLEYAGYYVKYAWMSTICYMPLFYLRTLISWTHLNNNGCIMGGKVIDTNSGHQVAVRAISGSTINPTNSSSVSNVVNQPGMIGSEWSTIISNLTDGTWENYSLVDLGFNTVTTWAKEYRTSSNPAEKLVLGVNQIDQWYFRDQGQTTSRGWRPVLQLVN